MRMICLLLNYYQAHKSLAFVTTTKFIVKLSYGMTNNKKKKEKRKKKKKQ
jgi:hypothetical protein